MGLVTTGSRHAARRAPEASSRRVGHGFTLVEILVVLVILALTAGLAALAWDGDERSTATREAKRLAGALEHAAMRAQVRAETLGVAAEGNGWRFWRRPADSSRWLPVTDDDVLSAHGLPPGMTVSPLTYAGQPLPANAVVPLRASGHNEPYALILVARDTRIVLAVDPLNRVAIEGIAAE